MRHLIYPLLILILSFSCTAEQFEPLADYPNAHLLMQADELNQLMQEEDLFLVDARDEIEEGVIPGAIHFPAISSLRDYDHEVEHFLIGPDEFQQKMREIGLNNNDRVVIYDDGNSLASARLFYALDYYGFGNTSILNGGIQSWIANELPLEDAPVQKDLGTFSFEVQEGLTCDFNYVMGAADNPDVIIFDARSEDEYSGQDQRALKGGHIPNAVNLEWNSVLEQDGIPYFLPASSIQAQYLVLGITPDKEVIPHCHTNVRGSHAYFTLRLMGYDSVRPYEGSWSEYGNNPDAIVNQ